MIDLIPIDHLVTSTVEWLNKHNGTGDAEKTLRILKIGEEFGEVCEAWIGWGGQNPRKGISHDINDVAMELCDVIITALVALSSITPIHQKDETCWDLLDERAHLIIRRMTESEA